MTNWTISLHKWKARGTSTKKVLVTGLCIFQTDNREFLQKGEGSGSTKKLAHEPHAIPSHRCTRRWRKWTRQGGGWWLESSLEVYILKAYKKNHGGPKQRLAMGTGRSWNQRKVYGGGTQTNQLNLDLIANLEEFHSWGFEGFKKLFLCRIFKYMHVQSTWERLRWVCRRHLLQTIVLISEGF